ncbi:hypothetical protein GCM10009118_24580 [Wandonia haliotis]|uniref:Uncharacterized protein n=1 Tax=Wandonia haliotis TaxID=574963 RepID=A0ABN1MSE1_9FLAO
MKQYINFTTKFGEGIKHQNVDIAAISEYDQYLLTNEVVEILSEEGISSYGDGFIWTLNPNDYVEWLNNWIQLEDRCVPFGRTAFGDLFFMKERQPMILTVSKGLIDYTTSRLDWFFNRYLSEDEFMDEYFNLTLYKNLSSKDLNQNECYGFKTLLSEGGAETISNVSKMDLKAYLASVSSNLAEVGFYKHE